MVVRNPAQIVGLQSQSNAFPNCTRAGHIRTPYLLHCSSANNSLGFVSVELRLRARCGKKHASPRLSNPTSRAGLASQSRICASAASFEQCLVEDSPTRTKGSHSKPQRQDLSCLITGLNVLLLPLLCPIQDPRRPQPGCAAFATAHKHVMLWRGKGPQPQELRPGTERWFIASATVEFSQN